MSAYHLRLGALAAAAAIGLSGCAYNGLYSGVSVGLGSGYYDPYYGYGYGYGAGYPRYGYGYGFDPYWGWYDNFYYPGSGYYVYDIYRRPHRWSDSHRRYWTVRRERALSTSTTRQPVVIRENWGDFDRDRTVVRRDRVQPRNDRSVRVERVNRSVEAERPVRVERANRLDQAERSVRVERTRASASDQAAARAERRAQAKRERESRRNQDD